MCPSVRPCTSCPSVQLKIDRQTFCVLSSNLQRYGFYSPVPATSVGCSIESVTHYRRHSWECVGASLPARPAGGFLAFVERTASTPPRLQRLVAASRFNSTTESVQTTPTEAASTMLVLPLSTKNPSFLLISAILTPSKYFVSMSAGLSFTGTFVILMRSFRTKC